MATTLTIAANAGKDLIIAHIGDSRAYLYRRKRLHQLTRDHTLVQELVAKEIISPQEASTHRMRHVLTNVLGNMAQEIQPEVHKLTLEDGDCLLLCTDGLTDMVSAKTITGILALEETSESTCRRLVDQALRAGGKDNVTVVVGRYRFASA
jgi:PPM family protein phosphatase